VGVFFPLTGSFPRLKAMAKTAKAHNNQFFDEVSEAEVLFVGFSLLKYRFGFDGSPAEPAEAISFLFHI
jgi:hypothetical protein